MRGLNYVPRSAPYGDEVHLHDVVLYCFHLAFQPFVYDTKRNHLVEECMLTLVACRQDHLVRPSLEPGCFNSVNIYIPIISAP